MDELTSHTESDSEGRKSRIGAWLLCLTIVATTLGVIVYRSVSRPRFDSEVWKSVSDNDPGKLAMVDDLLAQNILVGMTRPEIDALLGTPPQTSYFRDFDYVYWLGPERGFISIDSEWLCIDFDKDVVVDARLMRD